MNINLLTDAPKHNLALMKISAYHKQQGDNVFLNGVGVFDLTYGSWLYDFSEKGICNIEGGTIYPDRTLPRHIEQLAPDYSLYQWADNYSLGYSFRFCPRRCPFCLVPTFTHPDTSHHSIWEFHNSQFSKICLLNNNTFADPKWKETFEEIWDARLTVIDENGYDLRLIDEEKAEALKRTKWQGYIHYAWDLMEYESQIIRGLKLAPKGMVYVLIGYNTTQEEDFHRCQVIHDMGHDPYIMPYNRTKKERNFQRFINTRMYRKYKTIEEAWREYR